MQCKLCGKDYPLHCFPVDLQSYDKERKAYKKQEVCKTCRARPPKRHYSPETKHLYKRDRILSSTQVSKNYDELEIVGLNGDDEIFC